MLEQKLLSYWNSSKFATSWIIGVPDPAVALQEIKNLAQHIFNIKGLPIDNNPDFRVVSKEDAKYISVDQIRELQQFLYTTSSVGEYKFAVIFEAEFMNNNAANCCLKILEEPPRESYVFLITSNPGSLSATIKSRCHKFLMLEGDEKAIDKAEYNEFIKLLLNIDITSKMSYLQDIQLKSKYEKWEEFCVFSIELLSKSLKFRLNSQIIMSEEEQRYLSSYCGKYSDNELLAKFEKVSQLVNDANDFDLDKRHMGIMILECMT